MIKTRSQFVCRPRLRGLLAAAAMLIPLAPPVAPAADSPGAPRFHRVPGNLLQNSSFEENWFNHAFADRRRFLLLQASDMGVGECDGGIDYWAIAGKSTAWDLRNARTGTRSLRFDGPGSARQLVRFAGENSPRAGGAFYAYFMPLEKQLAWQVLRRPIIVGAWCKTENVPRGAEPKISLRLECGARQRFEELVPHVSFGKKILERTASAAGGSHDWEYVEVRLEATDLEPAPWFATVTLTAGGAGTVWFDDVSCVEPASPGFVTRPPQVDAPAAETVPVALPNRMPNGGFESLDATGWAAGWERSALWTWFRNDYYTFTGWSHSEAKVFRGGAVSDRMLAFSGNASLRLNVFPGDNFAVESAAIPLNQSRAHPIEVRAMVRADQLRTLEIMGRDERGGWLRQGDFLGDAMQEPGAYNMASTGAGTHDWICVRKFFSPEQPVKTLRVVLAARGFDGQIVEDKDIVGTAWIDDVEVFEHRADAEEPAPAAPKPHVGAAAVAPAVLPFRVVDLDLGERLWGRNSAVLTLDFPRGEAEKLRGVSLQLTLTDPRGKVATSTAEPIVVRSGDAAATKEFATVRVGYQITDLCQNWREQFTLSLQFLRAGQPLGPRADFAFGTPREPLTAGVSGLFLYRGETPFVFANLNIARDSLAELARCEFVLNHGGADRTVLNERDFSALAAPRRAPDYINTRNLVRAEIDSAGLTVHPWTDVRRDNRVTARLFAKTSTGEKLLAQSAAPAFGMMEPVPRALPEIIERTAVDPRGFITVNGRPFFPVCWRPHGESVAPDADYPPRALKFLTVDLTSIVYAKKAAPDAEVKAALLAKIEQVKNDPRLFQYEIGEGEMQLQDRDWTQRLEWCKTAIGWIREADPNHLINGPISWLVGHPDHDNAMKSFVGYWDAIGVESSFESPVLVNEVAKPLMTRRPTAVIVGLETYFYQPLEVLRWRGYRAVLEGAHGVGLCPSGMLESRPDKVNFLRGLNAEFRALAPAFMGAEPAAKCSADTDRVELFERVAEGKRILIATRKKDDAKAVRVRFTLPSGPTGAGVQVRFEGRTLAISGGGFSDEFATPYTVHVYELP